MTDSAPSEAQVSRAEIAIRSISTDDIYAALARR